MRIRNEIGQLNIWGESFEENTSTKEKEIFRISRNKEFNEKDIKLIKVGDEIRLINKEFGIVNGKLEAYVNLTLEKKYIIRAITNKDEKVYFFIINDNGNGIALSSERFEF